MNAAPEDAWRSDVPDLVVETNWADATAQVLANALLRTWQGRQDENEHRREGIRHATASAESTDDGEGQFVYTGQNTGPIDGMLPVGEVVRTIASDAGA
jgi:hypothetical protein